MTRIGVTNVLPTMNRSLGSGTWVGSGVQRIQTITDPATSNGTAAIRTQRIWARTQPPGPCSRDKLKPSTNTSCQHSGLKNHWPSVGQVGTVILKTSAQK